MRTCFPTTDPNEFFAEMAEAYFGSNDFRPIATGKSRRVETEPCALRQEISGPLPSRFQPKSAFEK